MERPTSHSSPEIPSILFDTLTGVAAQHPEITPATLDLVFEATNDALSLSPAELMAYADTVDQGDNQIADDAIAAEERRLFGQIANQSNAHYLRLINNKRLSHEQILHGSVGFLRELVAQRLFRSAYLRQQEQIVGTFVRDQAFYTGAKFAQLITRHVWFQTVQPKDVRVL